MNQNRNLFYLKKIALPTNNKSNDSLDYSTLKNGMGKLKEKMTMQQYIPIIEEFIELE